MKDAMDTQITESEIEYDIHGYAVITTCNRPYVDENGYSKVDRLKITNFFGYYNSQGKSILLEEWVKIKSSYPNAKVSEVPGLREVNFGYKVEVQDSSYEDKYQTIAVVHKNIHGEVIRSGICGGNNPSYPDPVLGFQRLISDIEIDESNKFPQPYRTARLLAFTSTQKLFNCKQSPYLNREESFRYDEFCKALNTWSETDDGQAIISFIGDPDSYCPSVIFKEITQPPTPSLALLQHNNSGMGIGDMLLFGGNTFAILSMVIGALNYFKPHAFQVFFHKLTDYFVDTSLPAREAPDAPPPYSEPAPHEQPLSQTTILTRDAVSDMEALGAPPPYSESCL